MQGIHMVSELLRNFLFFVQKLSGNTVQRYLNLLFYNQGIIISSFLIACTYISSCFGQVLCELKSGLGSTWLYFSHYASHGRFFFTFL